MEQWEIVDGVWRAVDDSPVEEPSGFGLVPIKSEEGRIQWAEGEEDPWVDSWSWWDRETLKEKPEGCMSILLSTPDHDYLRTNMTDAGHIAWRNRSYPAAVIDGLKGPVTCHGTPYKDYAAHLAVSYKRMMDTPDFSFTPYIEYLRDCFKRTLEHMVRNSDQDQAIIHINTPPRMYKQDDDLSMSTHLGVYFRAVMDLPPDAD